MEGLPTGAGDMVEGRDCGVRGDQLDLINLDPELIGDDLRENGIGTLPQIDRASSQFAGSILMDL